MDILCKDIDISSIHLLLLNVNTLFAVLQDLSLDKSNVSLHVWTLYVHVGLVIVLGVLFVWGTQLQLGIISAQLLYNNSESLFILGTHSDLCLFNFSDRILHLGSGNGFSELIDVLLHVFFFLRVQLLPSPHEGSQLVSFLFVHSDSFQVWFLNGSFLT